MPENLKKARKTATLHGSVSSMQKNHQTQNLMNLFLNFSDYLMSGSEDLYKKLELAGETGLEPAASGVTGRRYNQLNYSPAVEIFIKALENAVKRFQ